MKTFHIIQAAEMDYDRQASLDLREEIIAIRDKALAENNWDSTVRLSHVIAWMAVMIDREWPL